MSLSYPVTNNHNQPYSSQTAAPSNSSENNQGNSKNITSINIQDRFTTQNNPYFNQQNPFDSYNITATQNTNDQQSVIKSDDRSETSSLNIHNFMFKYEVSSLDIENKNLFDKPINSNPKKRINDNQPQPNTAIKRLKTPPAEIDDLALKFNKYNPIYTLKQKSATCLISIIKTQLPPKSQILQTVTNQHEKICDKYLKDILYRIEQNWKKTDEFITPTLQNAIIKRLDDNLIKSDTRIFDIFNLSSKKHLVYYKNQKYPNYATINDQTQNRLTSDALLCTLIPFTRKYLKILYIPQFLLNTCNIKSSNTTIYSLYNISLLTLNMALLMHCYFIINGSVKFFSEHIDKKIDSTSNIKKYLHTFVLMLDVRNNYAEYLEEKTIEIYDGLTKDIDKLLKDNLSPDIINNLYEHINVDQPITIKYLQEIAKTVNLQQFPTKK